MVSQEIVLKTLQEIYDDESGQDIVRAGMVSGVQISDAGDVLFLIEVSPERGPAMEPLRQRAERAVSGLPGVRSVRAILTAEKKNEEKSKARDPHGMEKNPRLNLPIQKIIAVASGKGGVGKSTVASNLACALALSGKKVGLLDADIYGPSQPLMMGLTGQKPETVEEKIQPLVAHGVKVMSIGFMVENEAPLIWRGPMVQTALYQLLRDVNWGAEDDPLDILIVDMPPGTGDAQLTMAQKVPLSGAIIVSTPQDIALIDARKAVGMFEKVGVPVIGIVENMAVHVCSSCGHSEHIFGDGGARAEADKIGVPFLGALPLDINVRIQGDAGAPIVSTKRQHEASLAFKDMATKINLG